MKIKLLFLFYKKTKLKQRRNRRRRNNKKKYNKSSSFLSNSSSPTHKSKPKKSFKSTKFEENKDADKTNKEMDSLELTIDSVARNFGTDLATGTDSSSDDEMQQDIVPSPVGVKPEPSAMSVNAELKQSSPKINSPSLPMNSTKSPSVLMTSPKVSFTFG